MIKLTSQSNGDQIRIMVSGHAGAGPHGYDLVCAAVSALTQSLEINAERAETFDKAGLSEIDMPYCIVNMVLYKAYLRSMRVLADQYPDNIAIGDIAEDQE
jgi:uncharacterized protein YsxB (DUF464 family)|uniref:YsxB-like protein n=1 Tax=Myoviridae sp. ctfWc3 TaxID=2827697 RepID=A0A8S5SCW8_9CAUD|nr:MAG TPA: YsxB-like protein [Myoviridae sp. ctfWc3]